MSGTTRNLRTRARMRSEHGENGTAVEPNADEHEHATMSGRVGEQGSGGAEEWGGARVGERESENR